MIIKGFTSSNLENLPYLVQVLLQAISALENKQLSPKYNHGLMLVSILGFLSSKSPPTVDKIVWKVLVSWQGRKIRFLTNFNWPTFCGWLRTALCPIVARFELSLKKLEAVSHFSLWFMPKSSCLQRSKVSKWPDLLWLRIFFRNFCLKFVTFMLETQLFSACCLTKDCFTWEVFLWNASLNNEMTNKPLFCLVLRCGFFERPQPAKIGEWVITVPAINNNNSIEAFFAIQDVEKARLLVIYWKWLKWIPTTNN